MSNMIIQNEKGQTIGEYSPEMVKTIKQTVAKNATDEELYMFLNVANMYGLNPFTKEIWFTKTPKMGTTIMTSRDGYVKIAKQKPNFQRLQSNAVYENDEFEMVWEGMDLKTLTHKHNSADRGKVIGAWAGIRSKDGDDTYVYVPFNEYNKGNTFWKYATAMIRKVAEKEVCRLFADVSGIYIPEEMNSEKYSLENSQKQEIHNEIEVKDNDNVVEAEIVEPKSEMDYEDLINDMIEAVIESGVNVRKPAIIKQIKDSGLTMAEKNELSMYVKDNLDNKELGAKYDK